METSEETMDTTTKGTSSRTTNSRDTTTTKEGTIHSNRAATSRATTLGISSNRLDMQLLRHSPCMPSSRSTCNSSSLREEAMMTVWWRVWRQCVCVVRWRCCSNWTRCVARSSVRSAHLSYCTILVFMWGTVHADRWMQDVSGDKSN